MISYLINNPSKKLLNIIPEQFECRIFCYVHLEALTERSMKSKNVEVKRRLAMKAYEHIEVVSNQYEKVKTFKYLNSLLTNQNFIDEEIKCRLEAGYSCYYSVQTLFCLLDFSLTI